MKLVNVGATLALMFTPASAQAQPRTGQDVAALRIVVVEGEDAVNIIDRKTAVRPVVEVRDRNNLPVSGATVQFTIAQAGGAARGAAFANGQSVMTVTTDAAGRAVSGQLQSLAQGGLRIQVQATYQGQVATATINQTNFATAAEAARAGRTISSQSGTGAGSGSAAGGTAGSTAVSTAGTIAGIGTAAVGGALAVKDVKGESCTSDQDRALVDLNAVVDMCGSGSSSAQCNTAAQRAAPSLGAWCSCDGRANVDAALRGGGTNLDELAMLAARGSVSFPASCR
jgi:hypothetical protein